METSKGSDMHKVIGIDIGGTSVKAGLFTAEGALEAAASMPTGALVGERAFADVAGMLFGLLREHGAQPSDVVGVGFDVPGPVDAGGNVGFLANIELDVDGLKAAMRKAFPQANLAFVNDANAAAVGEYWQGAGRELPSFALVALGTGVGAGVIANGRLVSGAFGTGGEIGHLTVVRDEPRACGCGGHGHLEQYASALGVVRAYREACARRGATPVELAGPTDTLAVFQAHRAGDEAAREAVSRMCDALGFAMAQVSAVVDPAAFLIGGGVGGGFDLFADELRAAFRTYCMPPCADARIIPAALGNAAALYGSAYLALAQAE